ncbi:unnamed protein product [Lactuca saligna]|uniref:Uncharacterized protein n=1 Tax=Lactuca saligna TaxID=75948 RepID=A0AA35YZ78_LACSI|nr:unnamed protein product [Lactuca saligna]
MKFEKYSFGGTYDYMHSRCDRRLYILGLQLIFRPNQANKIYAPLVIRRPRKVETFVHDAIQKRFIRTEFQKKIGTKNILLLRHSAHNQLETTKVGKAELFLLWCMITGSYRDIIIRRFHRVITLRTGCAIRCGGLIFVIACSLTLQSPPGYTFFTGESFRLTLQNLRAMHMLRTALGGYVWMQGRSTYFKVTGPDDIALVDPISDTVWVLQSNILLPPHPRRAQQPDPMQSDFQDQPPPTQPSYPDPNSPFTFQHYLDIRHDIASLQQTMTGLRLDYQLFSTQVTSYRDELLGLRGDFTDFCDDFFCRYAPPTAWKEERRSKEQKEVTCDSRLANLHRNSNVLH